MSTALFSIFAQRRQAYLAAQRSLDEARRVHAMYQRQAMAACLTEMATQQYCTGALARVTAIMKDVYEAQTAMEAAYAAIPEEERPEVDFWT